MKEVSFFFKYLTICRAKNSLLEIVREYFVGSRLILAVKMAWAQPLSAEAHFGAIETRRVPNKSKHVFRRFP